MNIGADDKNKKKALNHIGETQVFRAMFFKKKRSADRLQNIDESNREEKITRIKKVFAFSSGRISKIGFKLGMNLPEWKSMLSQTFKT